MNIKILVATHKKAIMPDNNDLYFPVLAGSSKNWVNGILYQRDDEGQNISRKNASYSELTAVYWAWKNLPENIDAVGLIHYRRIFITKSHKLVDQNFLERKFDKFDILVPKKRRYYIETNYFHYIHAHEGEPIEILQTIIKKHYPDYLSSFDKVMNSRSAHMFNMFIMKRPFFNEYCAWLFGILRRVELNIDITDYSQEEKRVFGFLSELLLDVWIIKNNLQKQTTEIAWQQLGKSHAFKKIIYMIGRKFGFHLKTHF
ncbi:hypothetical protein AYR62_02960 [Secundilactobacillus paracollinoides]|uniref:DUF4422 domain-containing protein n=1 Tax=Secundilactobacillus paracollinoides TaxID=240427 RepID=UPI00081A2B98|nr:DUF4422 domain-containing protein [Secundilactobacillus paracollinoides]ANZ63156.1 hypothetical protein AYR62_02960 [Secundilactobacillus paracollinoides]